MKSYAHQSLSRKRIKKLADQFTDDEIRTSLGEDADNRAFILEGRDGSALVGYWNAYSGPLTMMDDDSVRSYAQVAFMRRNGYPSFRSDAEIRAYAEQHGWQIKQRVIPKNAASKIA